MLTHDRDWAQNQSLSNVDPRLVGETQNRKDKGVCVGVEDDMQSEDNNRLIFGRK